jgi:hypothetical protein
LRPFKSKTYLAEAMMKLKMAPKRLLKKVKIP